MPVGIEIIGDLLQSLPRSTQLPQTTVEIGIGFVSGLRTQPLSDPKARFIRPLKRVGRNLVPL